MSSLGTSKGILEIAKFGVYVTVPVFLMYTFANNNQNLKSLMGNRNYVVYPQEAPRPPSPEELGEMARELARTTFDKLLPWEPTAIYGGGYHVVCKICC